MKNKIIVAVIILLAIVIIGLVYYAKNVMIVRDKDGMVFKQENPIAVTDETYKKGDD